MKKRTKIILHGAVILLLGLVELGFFWLIYLGLYLGIEKIYYSNNPTSFPADQLRSIASIILYIVYGVLLFLDIPKHIKAILSVAPNAVIVMMIILSFYTVPLLFVGLTLIFCFISIMFMIKQKTTWQFYFAFGYGVLLGLIYAWPR